MTEDWRNLPQRVLEDLSAYADGELAPGEERQLEARIKTEPAYRAALQVFRQAKDLMASIPEVRAPRSYALTQDMAGVRSRWRWFPPRQLATVLAALMLAVVVGVDVLTTGPVGAGMSLDMELRAQAPESADQVEATAELQALEEAEGEMGQEAEEPSAALQAPQGTVTPEGEIAGDMAAPTEADEESFRVGEEPQGLASESAAEASRLTAFFAERPLLRSIEILLGAVFLVLALSVLFRSRAAGDF